jgi:hypothetical protein
MEKVCEKIVNSRQLISPRTSYESSSEVVLVSNNHESTNSEDHLSQLSTFLNKSGEFKLIKFINENQLLMKNFFDKIHNQIILFWHPDEEMIKRLGEYVFFRKTRLVFAIFFHISSESANKMLVTLQELGDDSVISILDQIGDYHIISTYTKNLVLASTSQKTIPKSDWGNPSVQTLSQFKYIWNEESGSDCKLRVIQRLASNTIKSKNGTCKVKESYFEDLIIKLLILEKQDDSYIYNILRRIFQGKDITNNSFQPYEVPGHALIETKPWGEDSDGRALFMVKRTIECIPENMKSNIKTVLDYGCAEGAITSHLCRFLQVSPEKCFGADVRTLESKGFTFIHIPQETIEIPPLNSILPQLADRSIDLITAAMVFHHVKHVHATIRELRRVISDEGLLVMREHDCTTPYEATFLDITHGLYSLVLSDPIEWPTFLDEYQAWYRSREQWNNIMKECGFKRLENQSALAEKHYNAAVKPVSILKNGHRPANSDIPNVTKAYYAVYLPDHSYKLHPFPKSKPSTTSSSISFSLQQDINLSEKIEKYRNQSSLSSKESASHDDSPQNKRQKSNVNESIASNHISIEKEKSWIIYESSKHPGNFYITDESGGTHWIDKSTIHFNAISNSTSPDSFPTTGAFFNPLTRRISAFGNVEHKKKS